MAGSLKLSRIVGLALIVLFFGVLWLAYQRVALPYAVDRDDNVALSQVVSATFSKSSQLKVGTLRGTVQTTAADARMGGLLMSDQVMRAPYSADYFVDLSKLTLADYRWDPKARTLTMRVPDVTMSPANVDEGAMTATRRGLFITRAAFDAMSRTASRRAAAIADLKAREPAQMAEARANARAALSKMLTGPLNAIGRSDVAVIVRFPADGQSGCAAWDESSTLESALARGR